MVELTLLNNLHPQYHLLVHILPPITLVRSENRNLQIQIGGDTVKFTTR